MTTYSTGNPVGSPDPRDLYDNAENLDNAANSDNATWTDRLGESRRTMSGIEQDAIAAIQNAGYVGTGADNAVEDYAAGIEITQYNQIVRDGGEFWRVSGSETLPYTLTGAGVPEGGALVSVGDAALRQDLANGTAYVTSRTGSQTLAESLDDRAGLLTSDITVLIPTDYPTLQDAIDDFSKLRVTQGVTIDLMIEAGHQPASGILVSGGDYGHFKVSSMDAEVVVSDNFSFIADNARAPILNCLFDLSASGSFDSYKVNNGSLGFISSGAGMRNGTRGAHVTNASTISGDGMVFTGFQQAGAHSSRSSTIQCSFATLSDNSQDPNNNFGAVYASRASSIHGEDIDASGSGGDGLRAQRNSIIAVPGINVSGATKIALVAASSARIYSDTNPPTMLNLKGQALVAQQNGQVVIGGTDITFEPNMTDIAVECRNSHIECKNSIFSGHEGLCLFAKGAGSSIGASSCTVTGGATGAQAEEGAVINLANSDFSGGSGNGVFASKAAKIIVTDSSVTGYGSNDLAISEGSQISANSCTTTNGTGSPDVGDTNLTGGFNFSNNGNRGFIWT